LVSTLINTAIELSATGRLKDVCYGE